MSSRCWAALTVSQRQRTSTNQRRPSRPVRITHARTHAHPDHCSDDRIFNGEEANVADYPYLVSLRVISPTFPSCAGTLIRPNVVLTAAHCVLWGSEFDPTFTTAVPLAGAYLPIVVPAVDVPNPPTDPLPSGGKQVETGAISVHSRFQPDNPNVNAEGAGYDIALLFLKEELSGPGISTIEIAPRGSTYTSGEAFGIVGWGSYNPDPANPFEAEYPPPTLRDGEVYYVPPEQCLDDMEAFNINAMNDDPIELERSILNPVVMCAQGLEGTNGVRTDKCQGDSGGPMTLDDGGTPVQVGIVAWGNGCGGTTPSLYTNVAFMHDWIERQLKLWDDVQPWTLGSDGFKLWDRVLARFNKEEEED